MEFQKNTLDIEVKVDDLEETVNSYQAKGWAILAFFPFEENGKEFVTINFCKTVPLAMAS